MTGIFLLSVFAQVGIEQRLLNEAGEAAALAQRLHNLAADYANERRQNVDAASRITDRLTNKIQRAVGQRAVAQLRINVKNKKIERLNLALDEAQKNVQEFQKAFDSMEALATERLALIAEKNQEILGLGDFIFNLKNENDSIKRERDQLQLNLNSVSAGLENARDLINVLNTEIERKRSSLKDKDVSISSMEKKIEESCIEIEGLNKTIQEYKKKRQELEGNIKKLESVVQITKGDLEKSNNALKEEKIQRSLLDEKLKKANRNINNLSAAIQSRLNVIKKDAGDNPGGNLGKEKAILDTTLAQNKSVE